MEVAHKTSKPRGVRDNHIIVEGHNDVASRLGNGSVDDAGVVEVTRRGHHTVGRLGEEGDRLRLDGIVVRNDDVDRRVRRELE